MASPESEDSTSVLDRFCIAEPVAHDSSTDWSTSCLEETKEEINGKDEQISQRNRESNEIKPKGDVDKEQANSRPEETNSKDGGGIEGITKFSVDNISSSVGGHEDSVHLGKYKRRNPGLVLELLLHSGVTFTRKVGHEVTTKCNEEGPSATIMIMKAICIVCQQDRKQ